MRGIIVREMMGIHFEMIVLDDWRIDEKIEQLTQSRGYKNWGRGMRDCMRIKYLRANKG